VEEQVARRGDGRVDRAADLAERVQLLRRCGVGQLAPELGADADVARQVRAQIPEADRLHQVGDARHDVPRGRDGVGGVRDRDDEEDGGA